LQLLAAFQKLYLYLFANSTDFIRLKTIEFRNSKPANFKICVQKIRVNLGNLWLNFAAHSASNFQSKMQGGKSKNQKI